VEAGFSGFVPTVWNGLLTAARTDPAIVRRAQQDIETVMSTPEAVHILGDTLGLDVSVSTPDELKAQIARETAFWHEMFQQLDIKPQ
jgi:tripartite-type tricarboxylate transporter receptor subunit TctC